jgi:hypothetical protein
MKVGQDPEFPAMEYPEVFPDEPLFIHRGNRDGTTDSFCRKCFMTVASSQWEADLEPAESNHKCDPIQMEHLYGVLNQVSKSDHQEGC